MNEQGLEQDPIYRYFYNELSDNDRKIYAFLLGRLFRENFYINPDGDTFIVDKAVFSLTSLVWKFNKYNMLNYDRKIIRKLIKDIIIKKLYIFDILHGLMYISGTDNPICKLDNYTELIKKNLFKGYHKFISGENVDLFGENYVQYIDFIYNFAKSPITISSISFTDIINLSCQYQFDIQYLLSLPEAIPPEKNRFSDTGYDLHLVKKIKEENGVVYYNTGIRMKVGIPCYYLDIVPRSSLVKMGWTLANCVGIIDSGYRGDIIIALAPIGTVQKELILPFKAVQAIPRKVLQGKLVIVDSLEETDRENNGGLGSKNFG